jgi:hypothetical protein
MPAGVAPSASPITNTNYEVLGKSTGSASHIALLGFIPLGKADIEAAIQEAIKKKDGDALINVRYWQRSIWLCIATKITFEVEGDVIKYKTRTPKSTTKSTKGKSNISPKKK